MRYFENELEVEAVAIVASGCILALFWFVIYSPVDIQPLFPIPMRMSPGVVEVSKWFRGRGDQVDQI